MPTFEVKTAHHTYPAIVERGILQRAGDFIPAGAGKLFLVTTEDVWRRQRVRLSHPHEVLFLPGGEESKRLAPLEALAGQMVRAGGDRSSVVLAFGGGIVNGMAGFLAAIFMRGIPVLQLPTTLLAQVDASIGGKTGVNLVSGKNLIGSFHQPVAVLIDPSVLSTLPEREYRAGLYEVIKYGVIRSAELFRLLAERREEVLALAPRVVERIISESVRIKAEVVSADERESGLRRILNFGHTIGHALEAETSYSRLLHGEAVAFGMQAAVRLAEAALQIEPAEAEAIRETIRRYGPIPPLNGIRAENLLGRLSSDKKTVQGKVHFVLPRKVGDVTVVSGLDDRIVLRAIEAALA